VAASLTLINTTGARVPQAVPLTVTEIIGLVPNAVCPHGPCWAPHLQPCVLPAGVPAGSFHAARLTRLTRSGVITAADAARVLAACGKPGAGPATIIPASTS
jgi:hypothetical protein